MNQTVELGADALSDAGFWLSDSVFRSEDEAFAAARDLVEGRCAADGTDPVVVIGDFVIPPLGEPPSRAFQTLHFDFGLPLHPRGGHSVARFTALVLAPDAEEARAMTRLVPLAPLLRQRDWPARGELLDRFIAYGRTHGARDDGQSYSEGSLARIIEAASGGTPALPSVKVDPAFLCGLEFDTQGAELAFFHRHGLNINEVAVDILLRPGQLLVFDNLALAHGRCGIRQPGELRQRVFGYPELSPSGQRAVRDRLLDAFDAGTISAACPTCHR